MNFTKDAATWHFETQCMHHKNAFRRRTAFCPQLICWLQHNDVEHKAFHICGHGRWQIPAAVGELEPNQNAYNCRMWLLYGYSLVQESTKITGKQLETTRYLGFTIAKTNPLPVDSYQHLWLLLSYMWSSCLPSYDLHVKIRWNVFFIAKKY